MRPIPIAKFQNVCAFCQQSTRLSFFNSPWFPHRQGLAIDIYDGVFGGAAFSPISGEILAVKRFKSPESKYFKSNPWEWGILIVPFDNEAICAKVLHAEPIVEKGEEVQVGTPIGMYVRNGYFEPWTGPHLHLEIRVKKFPLNTMFRASGGLNFESLVEPKIELNSTNELVGQVQQVNPHFLSVEFGEAGWQPHWKGFPAKVGASLCVVDGGLAYYDKFGGILGDTSNILPNTPIVAGDRVIGHIVRILGPRRALVQFSPVNITINDQHVMGLSLSTTFTTNQLRIVDRNGMLLNYKEGDEIIIKIL